MLNDLVDRWERTGLLVGLSEDKKHVMACAFENQRLFNEATDTSSQFKKISIPMVRRILSQVDCKSDCSEKHGKIIETKIEWFPNEPCRKYHCLSEAESVAILSEEIKNWIINNNIDLNFRAFDLVNNKIVIHVV